MQRAIIIIIFLTGIIHLPATLGATGPGNDSIQLSSPLYREKFHMVTDRSLYAAGETVLFRVFNMSHTLLKTNNWSRVIYIELINNRNIPVAQGKYLLSSDGTSGQIVIPDTLTTGSYYIRAYTKWMRNYQPSEYFHAPLAIINPYKMGTAGNEAPNVDTGDPGPGSRYAKGITCTTDQPSYGKREKVTLQLEEIIPGISPDGYCITIIKDGYLDTDYNYSADQEGNVQAFQDDVLYLPETKGLSISGYVAGGQDRHSVANASVFFTLLGSDPDCFELKTNESGKINISLPNHSGSRDILITVDSEEDEQIQIILDDEFSLEYSDVPTSTVNYFPGRRDLIEEIMVNSQVKKSFMSAVRDALPPAEAKPGLPFYGNPDFRYLTDDYIELPNLDEFFYELVPSVMVVKARNRRFLAVLGEFSDMSIYPALVLLDYVPVLDDKTILPVSPQRINYIDVINTVYIRGNNYYGGVISMVSREGDRAGVRLPTRSLFFNYSTFSESDEIVFPDYSKTKRVDRIPDLRITLNWIPQYNISPDGGNSIEFYTSDVGGEFVIIVQGITEDGRVVRGSGEFSVQ